ncbi:hypothetical protein DA2_0651 [Desulfovibrio sp. A2]|nr:hypothetical protein DA2_0651 [Desulfovibrio sp. A2]
MLRGDACAIAGTIRRWSSSTEIAHEDLFIRYKYKIIGGGFTIDEMQILTGAEYAAVLRDERLR